MAAARACVQLTPGPGTVTGTVGRPGSIKIYLCGGSQISLLHVPLTTTTEGGGSKYIRPHKTLLIMHFYFDMIDGRLSMKAQLSVM